MNKCSHSKNSICKEQRIKIRLDDVLSALYKLDLAVEQDWQDNWHKIAFRAYCTACGKLSYKIWDNDMQARQAKWKVC